MMQKTLLIVVLLVAVNISFADDHFLFCYDPYPPYTFGDSGEATGGLKVEILNAIFDQLDHLDATAVLLPWQQCQNQARRGQVDGILPLYKNDERNSYLLFSAAVIQQQSVFFYRNTQFPDGLAWQTYADISALPLGMLNGSYINAEMEAAFADKKGIHRAKSVANLFELLAKGRIELIAIDKKVGEYVTKTLGKENEFSATSQSISTEMAYLGVAKNSPLAERLTDINTVIANLKATGALTQLIESTDFVEVLEQ